MLKPKFNYTNKIVNNLVEITAARGIILNSYLVPKWEVSLRREALLRATHASTAIEGNPLTFEEKIMLAQGRKVIASRKAKQEVLNYLDVLEHIKKYHEKNLITEKMLLKMHNDITKNTLDDPAWEKEYRKIKVYVGNKNTGEVIFTPPGAKEVPSLTNQFLKWLNSEESKLLHAVLVAGISHYEFVRIHPFVDGNGRTARALATLILYLRGFDIKRFFVLDDYYDSDRKAYYNALKSVDQHKLDITKWLEYFTDGVYLSISQVKKKVLHLSLEKGKISQHGQVALTEKQMKIIEFMQKNGKITNKDVRKMFNLSNRGALDEINKLVVLDIIIPKGKGGGLYYVLE
ncbi:MAG: Fic family protein [Caldisericota bacterium]|nr:Fic family protein [Caldisericota bacterium]